jgi:hypothetical protein
MDARFKPVNQVLSKRGIRFRVPPYQRGYEWEHKHFDDLWNDLQRIGEGVDFHYMGNVILRSEENDDATEIVDGQQRLVTISVFIMAIRDELGVKNDDIKQIEDILNAYVDMEKHPRLKLNDDGANESYKTLWRGETEDAEGNIGSAYRFYSRKVAGLSDDELKDLLRDITKNLRLVETQTDDTRIAYMIFQSQNERGTEVNPEVLAKARMYGEAERLDQPKQVTGQWDAIYDQLKRKLGPPRFRSDLSVRRPMAQILVNSKFETPTKIDKSQLYRNFDQILRSYNDIFDFLEWFKSQVDIYLELSSNSYHVNVNTLPRSVERPIQHLNSCSTHSEVLSLAIYNNADISKEGQIKSYYDLAATLVMRMELAGYSSASKRDALYNTAKSIRETDDVNEIRDVLKESIRDNAPQDPEIIEHLKANDLNIQGSWNFRTMLKLVSIEESRRRDRSRLPIEELEVEHIAPRNTYGKTNKYFEWKGRLTEDEYDDRKDKLGNLTLLLPEDHSSLNESSFDDKCNTYVNSDISITAEIADNDTWGDEKIEDRTEALANEIANRWSI